MSLRSDLQPWLRPRDPRLYNFIESQLTEVDRLFDLFVRDVVLQDPDARRVE